MDQILYTFIRELLAAEGIPAHDVRMPWDGWSRIDLGLRRDILGMDDLSGRMEQRLARCEDAAVYHTTDVFQCSYTCLRVPGERTHLIIGPLLFERVDDDRIRDLLQKLKLPDRLRQPLRNYYAAVKLLPYRGTYENLIHLTADHLYGKGLYQVHYDDAGTLDSWRHFYSGSLHISDHPVENVRHVEERCQIENALLLAVAAGNEAQALAHFFKLQSIGLPQRLSNALRDRQDYAIALNTAMGKAVERIGIHPVHVDSYSNQNVRRIEGMTRTEQSAAIGRKMVRGYCRMVREYKLTSHSLPVQKVIALVSADLTADLSLKSLAEQTNLNASYLSSLFHREIGIPLTEYVNRCRVVHAQRLMLSTNLPTKSIALQCGVSDIYYFGRLFKRFTGMTPRSYRDKGGLNDLQDMASSIF